MENESREEEMREAREFGIGSALSRAREGLDLSFEEAEQATKIRKDFLRGLESDDHSGLPESVYVRGFVKTYADYLGLDGSAMSRALKNDGAARYTRRGLRGH